MSPEETAHTYKLISRVNQCLGGISVILRHLSRFSPAWKPGETIRILDIGTGSADIPQAVVRWCRKRKYTVRVTALDLSGEALRMARSLLADYPEIQFQSANALDPPFPDAGFDLVMCNLALHHFSVEDAVRVLRRMWRLTRGAILVNDLIRGRVVSFFAGTVIPLFMSNPITRFDAYLSTRRAFSDNEMLRLAFHAGIPGPRIRRYFPGRQVLSAWKEGKPGTCGES